VKKIMVASCESMRRLRAFEIDRLHSLFESVWAPHCQSIMWRSFLSSSIVRCRAFPAAPTTWLVTVARGDDVLFAVGVAQAVGLDVERDKT
jgi:hypothetical protein